MERLASSQRTMWSSSNLQPQWSCRALRGLHDNCCFWCCGPLFIATERAGSLTVASCQPECIWDRVPPSSTIISAYSTVMQQELHVNQQRRPLDFDNPEEGLRSCLLMSALRERALISLQRSSKPLPSGKRTQDGTGAKESAALLNWKRQGKGTGTRCGLPPLLLLIANASPLLPSPRDTVLQAAGPVCKRTGRRGCRTVYIWSNLSPSLEQLLAYNQQISVQSSHAEKHTPLTFSAAPKASITAIT